jgi:hypothetical protein
MGVFVRSGESDNADRDNDSLGSAATVTRLASQLLLRGVFKRHWGSFGGIKAPVSRTTQTHGPQKSVSGLNEPSLPKSCAAALTSAYTVSMNWWW